MNEESRAEVELTVNPVNPAIAFSDTVQVNEKELLDCPACNVTASFKLHPESGMLIVSVSSCYQYLLQLPFLICSHRTCFLSPRAIVMSTPTPAF